ncbi:hypothetical protein B484DRAFT_461969 [Ochromonadaceae sp. CCMP2298]|nr:hypothetical protein B484DRAFT_461969 [Ochromonadaceae sp. CCMP2298]
MSQDSAPIHRRLGGREGTRAHAAILLTQEEVTDQDGHGHGGAALPATVEETATKAATAVEGDGTAVEGDGTAAEGETLAAVEGEGTAAEVEETAAEGETLAAVEGDDPTVAITTSVGVKYRQRVVRPADNHANLMRAGSEYITLEEGLPHLRKLDQSKKPMRVILAYHAGSEAMCRKWYLKRLNLPAQDEEAAIPGYMRDLAFRPQYADVYIADGAAQNCMYSHITIAIQQALEEQSAFEDQQEADADADGNEGENFDEPDI